MAGTAIIHDTKIRTLIEHIVELSHRGEVDHLTGYVGYGRVANEILAAGLRWVQIQADRVVELCPLRLEAQAGPLADKVIAIALAVGGI